jgi:WD40 repeat protein
LEKEPCPFPDYVAGYVGKHTGAISRVQFSSDGKYAATAGVDTTLRVLDVEMLDDLLQERVKQVENDENFSKSFFDTTGVRFLCQHLSFCIKKT